MNEWLQRGRDLLGRYKQVFLVIAVGVFLMLLPTGKGNDPQKQTRTEEETFSVEAFEERLEGILSQVAGAGRTKVILSLDGSNRRVLAQDEERDGDGLLSASTVTLGRGAGEQSVVPLQTLAPRFRGALVVCTGGDDPQVRLKLSQAVANLTGLGIDRITICQGNS